MKKYVVAAYDELPPDGWGIIAHDGTYYAIQGLFLSSHLVTEEQKGRLRCVTTVLDETKNPRKFAEYGEALKYCRGER